MEKRINVAVLVSGGGTNLQAIIDAEKSGVIKSAHIALVISNKSDAYALERAKNSGIDSAVVIKKECKDNEEFEQKITDIIEANNIDLIVLAGFMCILSEKFTNHFKDRILNIHPSLIPSFCGEGFYGLRVHQAALEKGVKVTGATVHFVNEIPDGGKIIMQKAVEIQDGDTPEILQKRVMEQAEWVIYPLAIEKVSKNLLEGE